MQVVRVRNVQQALPEGLYLLSTSGIERSSRNGPVLVAPGPVTTVYERPRERVIFWDRRDANPFFHLMESLWMLAGRNDVAFPARYVQRMRQFSDDGKTFHGAYGYRWRKHFGFDQLAEIHQILVNNPDDRRCVLQMWDGTVDLGKQGKDFPCNTQIYFSRDVNGRLDMTVCNRSNDIIWGAYGANAVHMSFLQEFMAGAIGCEVGIYYQMSNNYHAYLDTYKPLVDLIDFAKDGHRQGTYDPYEAGHVEPFPIMQTPVLQWQQDLMVFLDHGPVVGLRDPFFRRVVGPMYHAYNAYKQASDPDRFDKAIEILHNVKAQDWQMACMEWIARRQAAAAAKAEAAAQAAE